MTKAQIRAALVQHNIYPPGIHTQVFMLNIKLEMMNTYIVISVITILYDISRHNNVLLNINTLLHVITTLP